MSKQRKHRGEMRGLFWTKILVGCMVPKTQVVAVVIILMLIIMMMIIIVVVGIIGEVTVQQGTGQTHFLPLLLYSP